MTTYIAQFTAKHAVILIKQNSIFIWQQESGEIDILLLANKIKRESSLHFFRLVAGDAYNIELNAITVDVKKAVPFLG